MVKHTVGRKEQIRVNQSIMNDLQDVYQNAELRRMDRDSAVYAEEFNKNVLENENINPKDGIPAYVERMLMPTGDSSVTDDDLDQVFKNDLEKIYEKAFSVRDKLTDATKDALGDDYTKFESEKIQKQNIPQRRGLSIDGLDEDMQPFMHNGRRLPEGYSNVYDESDSWSFDEKD